MEHPVSVIENGAAAQAERPLQEQLPESVVLSKLDFQRMPSPGTLRDLKAQTGHTYMELAGPEAELADQFQTAIWVKLRRDFPGLRWGDCDAVEPIVDAEDLSSLDPTRLAGSALSPPSVASTG